MPTRTASTDSGTSQGTPSSSVSPAWRQRTGSVSGNRSRGTSAGSSHSGDGQESQASQEDAPQRDWSSASLVDGIMSMVGHKVPFAPPRLEEVLTDHAAPGSKRGFEQDSDVVPETPEPKGKGKARPASLTWHKSHTTHLVFDADEPRALPLAPHDTGLCPAERASIDASDHCRHSATPRRVRTVNFEESSGERITEGSPCHRSTTKASTVSFRDSSPSIVWKSPRKSKLEPLVSSSIVAANAALAALQRAKAGCISFENCLQLSRLHGLPIREIRQLMMEFSARNISLDKTMTLRDFESVVREKYALRQDEPFPHHLHFQAFEPHGDEDAVTCDPVVTMNDFVFYWKLHVFDEGPLLSNPKDRELRRLAREWNCPVPLVEKIAAVYEKSLEEGKETLSELGFRAAVTTLTGVPPYTRQSWLEANIKGTQSITMTDFVAWYLKKVAQKA